MGAKKIPINPECGRRLDEWLKDVGIKPTQAAREIEFYCQQQISNVINGNRRMKIELAQLISEKIKLPVRNKQGDIIGYDSVNPQWLLCLDNKNRTLRELNAFQIKTAFMEKAKEEDGLLLGGLRSFAILNGYSFTYREVSPENSGDIFKYFEDVKKVCCIEKDGEKVNISLGELYRLENEICDMVAIRLKYLFQEKGSNSNG